MSESVDILLKLIRLAIGTEKDYSFPKEVNWKEVCDLSFSQGVASIAVDGFQVLIENNPDACNTLDLPENENLKYEWFWNIFIDEGDSIKHSSVLNKLNVVFNGMPFLVMKGLSCADYYPHPNHRACGDIDIYLGCNYEKSNETLKADGIPVEYHYYRHSVSHIGKVMIENHRVLGDLRGPKHMMEFERLLEQIANRCLSGKSGYVKPSADFNALFLPWHVSAHFAFEKITLKHLLDWALFIKQDSKKIDMAIFSEAKEKYTFGFSKFADVLTAMSIRYLNIPKEALPEQMVSDAMCIDTFLCERILNYMFEGTLKERDSNIWKFRFNNVKRILREQWKYKEMYGVNVLTFLWYNIIGVLTKKGE